MTIDPNPTELAWLLRTALQVHRRAIARALAAGGHPRLPPLALWSIDAIGAGESTAGELAERLGVTKQAMSQVVDLLHGEGYLTRTVDPADRRRVLLRLSSRGRSAATAIAKACASVAADARELTGDRALAQTRDTLAAIARH